MTLRKALLPLLLLAACAAWNPPINTPLTTGPNLSLVAEDTPVTDGEIHIGLAFSGGGMRASAFAYGMAKELRAAGFGGANGLLDLVRLVSELRAGR